MQSWEILKLAIPEKASERIAQLLCVRAASVRRWRRRPESDDAPLSTGQKSILDRFCAFLDAVFIVNPKGVALIIEFINEHYRQLVNTHAPVLPTHNDRARQSSEVLREAVDVVDKLNLEGCSAATIIELVELRDKAEQTIAAVRKTMREENTVN